MATFELIEDGVYRVDGEITQEDVDRINSFQIRTCLVLQNTKGQSSDIIGKINTDNVYFSILGGLDYYQKDKYNAKGYIERTQSAPKGLTKILQYFERIEADMKPEWTDTQKCMYAYNALAVDTDYVPDLEQDILSPGVTERGLNGVLYNQLTCAGMAQTFKEMMDRLDIPCYYQNVPHVHSFNVVKLDGKYRGIDVTWDCTGKEDGKCHFWHFGRDPEFYDKKVMHKGIEIYPHRVEKDKDETVFDLTTFTDQELRENYSVIGNAINHRKKIVHPFRNFDTDRKRKFLPVDRFMEELQSEGQVLTKLKLLKQFGFETQEIDELVNATRGREGFIRDYVGQRHGAPILKSTLDEISKTNGLDGNLIMKNYQLLFLHYQDGTRLESPLTEEQCKTMGPELLGDVEQFYRQFFANGASQIDKMIEEYTALQNVPPELTDKVATLRTQLYTKINLFANGQNFFKSLGIPIEDIELVGEKARDCLEKTKVQDENPRSKHENDLDVLSAIIQNDVVDVIYSGREYSEDDFRNLIQEVRENWKDGEFADEEFKALLNEALDRTMNSRQVTEDTKNAGIGIDDANAVTQEIRRTQTNELQQSQLKE